MKLFIIGIIYGPMLLAALGGFIRYRAIMGFQSTLNEGLDFKTFRQRIKASEFGGRYKLGMALMLGGPLVTLVVLVITSLLALVKFYSQ
ncbi:hypothetical protein WJ96_05225 [Burkholderia ubonensis]|uniref:Uncharacterized protein n=1 Tax=Burkholderia ubonensis TaxID=101571 RepID=A0AAW3MXD1_9BURK|nr:hypothetical protein [Burkholderia ubonensis]KVP97973.1 hypothetical protein WJ96_05225 [Burkholderia ubonensis]KVZ92670.1 hypothetical protein WL25_16880 [Burkholderia ubonensis]